jgi:capsular polysaccharide transport system ATP-binding protein
VSLRHPRGKTTLRDLSFRIRAGERWQVLSDNRLLSACLLRCVAGLTPPQAGAVTIRGHVSWPLGQVSGLSRQLSCAENSRFFAGVYGQHGQREQELHLIQQLSDLNSAHWQQPYSKLPAASQHQFKLALSLAFDFDLYVLDPTALLGLHRRGAWTEEWQALLQRRLQERAVITLGSDKLGVADHCRKGLVLSQGRMLAQGRLERCQTALAGGVGESCSGV